MLGLYPSCLGHLASRYISCEYSILNKRKLLSLGQELCYISVWENDSVYMEYFQMCVIIKSHTYNLYHKNI